SSLRVATQVGTPGAGALGAKSRRRCRPRAGAGGHSHQGHPHPAPAHPRSRAFSPGMTRPSRRRGYVAASGGGNVMSDLFELSIPWWEIVLRGTVVYFVLLLLLRLSGKRTVGQFTPFDLLVL